jgi:hypothetical protein
MTNRPRVFFSPSCDGDYLSYALATQMIVDAEPQQQQIAAPDPSEPGTLLNLL